MSSIPAFSAVAPASPDKRLRKVVAGMPFDLMHLETVDRMICARPGSAPFVYVVTPNVDHVVRCHQLHLQHLYEQAWLSVCDSRILARLAPLVSVRFPEVVTGSDLTRRVFDRYLDAGDHVTIIGSESDQIALLQQTYPDITIHHHNPPMGFIRKPEAVEEAARFVAQHPSRFIFLAVGSPQQEKLALHIQAGTQATGIGLCIGASIAFITGAEQRAPLWVQRWHAEWLYRLAQNPQRLWRRYLVDNPKIFTLILRDMRAQQRGGHARQPPP